jgi:hypothetical protein
MGARQHQNSNILIVFTLFITFRGNDYGTAIDEKATARFTVLCMARKQL